ncbi:MAG TPA: peptidoglycan DD-metalloendopeptidase family protein [Candidatus Paceibacterota bacterium]|nr:peptidoglycan DD-metalloendopeptidase family protein [Candidatus Paceibacterota bacterium]
MGVAATAHAGIFSLMGGVFETVSKQDQLASVNSQNMTLLQPALNPNPSPFRGGGDTTIVASSALLPDSGPLGTLADIEEAVPGNDQISVYIVREGDTISAIAEMFKVSENTVRWANELKKGASLVPGQELVILPITGIRHTVKSGDTLESLAKKYHSSAEEISQFNGLDGDGDLVVGAVIIVPEGEISAPVEPAKTKKILPSIVGKLKSVGGFLWPVRGGIKTQGIHGNNGIDIGASIGTDVYAALPGQVLVARSSGWNGGYGNYVVIRHANGVQTLYSHLSSVAVRVGQTVERGEGIGTVGNTGRSTGPHLHFEVRGASNPF